MEKTIAEQIYQARITAGLTQQELADQCGISRTNIYRIESGIIDPKVSTVDKIAKIVKRNFIISSE